MKVAQINNLCGRGSTGKIVVQIGSLADKANIDNKIFFFSQQSKLNKSIKITNRFYILFQAFKSRVLGNYGFNSLYITKKLIKYLEKYNPDIVHIHNIHAHNVNLEYFFNYLKLKRKKVIYTFHDCWAFTGYCPHFMMEKCNKWKSSCNNCSLRKEFSWFFDKSSKNFERKKRLMNALEMTIVTPSNWMADLVKESFLKEHPVIVINNGIDLNVFKPTESQFRKTYNLEGKYVLLGVADSWGPRKGLDVFIELSEKLSKKYKIVLVGTNKQIDKKLPNNIISIHKTQNQLELAKIYTAADLFLNPTREDNFPTVNMESLACGTPVLTFKTGGSPEMLNESCGSVVDCDDVGSFKNEVIRICETIPFSKKDCLKRAKSFDMNDRLREYIDLYTLK